MFGLLGVLLLSQNRSVFSLRIDREVFMVSLDNSLNSADLRQYCSNSSAVRGTLVSIPLRGVLSWELVTEVRKSPVV
jgi:hypothetical protein